jgi:nucleoside-triphosphatase THEP1
VSLSHDPAPVLGAIHYERDFDINSILRTVVKSLQKKGVMVGGVLQESEFRPDGCCAQLNIVDIRTGKTERITQNRGRESRGCKLDPRGLAAISHCITDAIDADVDLVIINKFGRAESEGDGLLSCIADALSAGVPILTTVREPTAAASEASADIVTPYHTPCPVMFWSTHVCPLSVESQMESLGASTAASVSPSAEDEMERHKRCCLKVYGISC